MEFCEGVCVSAVSQTARTVVPSVVAGWRQPREGLWQACQQPLEEMTLFSERIPAWVIEQGFVDHLQIWTDGDEQLRSGLGDGQFHRTAVMFACLLLQQALCDEGVHFRRDVRGGYMQMICDLALIYYALRREAADGQQDSQFRPFEPDAARNGGSKGLHASRHGEKIGDEVPEIGLQFQA